MKKQQFSPELARSVLTTLATALSFGAVLLSAPDASAVGVQKLSLTTNPGSSRGNFISAPLLKPRVWRGAVDSIAGNVITVEGGTLPADLGRRLGDGTLNAAGSPQYIVITRWEANAAFPSTGVAGDWWHIDSSTGTTVAVAPGVQGPSVSLQAGDRIEIVPLANLRDLFGGPGGPTTILNKDNNGGASVDEEDVIFFMGGSLGLNFASNIIFHNGALTGGQEGYIVNGTDGPFDGQYLTVGPDQAFFVYRLKNTANVNGFNAGHAHRAPLTHYCLGSASGSYHTGVGTGFPVNAPIGGSGLHSAAGFNLDNNGGPSTAEEDVLWEVGGTSGTSFPAALIRHDGTLTGGTPVWVLDPPGVPDDTTAVQSGRGYFLGRKSLVSTPLLWRENHPFKL